jgi:general secretion pathway protein L
MLNLNSTVDMDFKGFLRWWQRELSFLIPENIRQLINDRQGFIIVSPENGHLLLTYSLGEHSEPVAKLVRNEAGAAQFKALSEQDERLAKARVIIRLTGHQAIQRELALPAAAKENLQQVVAYELDRYTPFKAEQVYFAVKPLTGAQEPGQIKAMLILTPREVLDALCEDLQAMGLSPLYADYEGFANPLDYHDGFYNLLPERLRQKSASTPRLIHAGMITGVILLALTALVLPVALQYRAVGALEAKVHGIEKEAKKIKTQQQEVDAIINETQKLLDEKRNRPMVVLMLNELSRLIKDDTSLAYLQYSDGHLQIQGESPAASTLIGIMEASDLFNNARFVSPVTQNTLSKLERFQITADVTTTGNTHGHPEKTD